MKLAARYIVVAALLVASVSVFGQKPKVSPGRATLKDSLAIYNDAKRVQDFYERSGLYKKTGEVRLVIVDPVRLHAGNDKKYAEVVRTIADIRLTPQGKRRIKPEEYRVVIDQYRYKQRELSDYVLNTNAPMQLFDRRIAPQLLMDYMYTGDPKGPLNNDDVDFKMYDPIAVKPYSLLTPEEKAERTKRYPPVVQPVVKPVLVEKPVKRNPPPKEPQTHMTTEYVISGSVPDSLRFRRFKTKKEAEEFVRELQSGQDE